MYMSQGLRPHMTPSHEYTVIQPTLFVIYVYIYGLDYRLKILKWNTSQSYLQQRTWISFIKYIMNFINSKQEKSHSYLNSYEYLKPEQHKKTETV